MARAKSVRNIPPAVASNVADDSRLDLNGVVTVPPGGEIPQPAERFRGSALLSAQGVGDLPDPLSPPEGPLEERLIGDVGEGASTVTCVESGVEPFDHSAR